MAETTSPYGGPAPPEACGLLRLHLQPRSGAKYTIIKSLAALFQTVIRFLFQRERKASPEWRSTSSDNYGWREGRKRGRRSGTSPSATDVSKLERGAHSIKSSPEWLQLHFRTKSQTHTHTHTHAQVCAPIFVGPAHFLLLA